jgi:hypothetical protein
MTTYGFVEHDIDRLAEQISQALSISLYRQFSPMIGQWYTDVDVGKMIAAFLKGERTENPQPAARFQLLLNDPEPGYTSPTFPGEGNCLLQVGLNPAELIQIEAKLRQAGLAFKRLQ